MTVMLMFATLSVTISMLAAAGVMPVWTGPFFAIMAIIFLSALVILKLKK